MADSVFRRFHGRGSTNVELQVSEAALSVVEGSAIAVGLRETGGILIGYYHSEGSVAVVTEATSRPKDSRFGRAWFQRGVSGLRGLLKSRWDDGRYYIGEWHSHPLGPPDPSWDDIAAMRALAEDPAYRCPKPLMLIAGTTVSQAVRLSAHVFENGKMIGLYPEEELLAAAWVMPHAMDAGKYAITNWFPKEVADPEDGYGIW